MVGGVFGAGHAAYECVFAVVNGAGEHEAAVFRGAGNHGIAGGDLLGGEGAGRRRWWKRRQGDGLDFLDGDFLSVDDGIFGFEDTFCVDIEP
jgi:hypothetical protein